MGLLVNFNFLFLCYWNCKFILLLLVFLNLSTLVKFPSGGWIAVIKGFNTFEDVEFYGGAWSFELNAKWRFELTSSIYSHWGCKVRGEGKSNFCFFSTCIHTNRRSFSKIIFASRFFIFFAKSIHLHTWLRDNSSPAVFN